MKLNLGCGLSKLEGYVNVDIDPSLEPDRTFDFTKPWPIQDGMVEEIVMYHTLEHVQKKFHQDIFAECWRVLAPNGLLVLTYPEFGVCAQNLINNERGLEKFWEATIYGRQLSHSDFHVCAMITPRVIHMLIRTGFHVFFEGVEPIEVYNTVIKARKDEKNTYEEALASTLHVNAA